MPQTLECRTGRYATTRRLGRKLPLPKARSGAPTHPIDRPEARVAPTTRSGRPAGHEVASFTDLGLVAREWLAAVRSGGFRPQKQAWHACTGRATECMKSGQYLPVLNLSLYWFLTGFIGCLLVFDGIYQMHTDAAARRTRLRHRHCQNICAPAKTAHAERRSMTSDERASARHLGYCLGYFSSNQAGYH